MTDRLKVRALDPEAGADGDGIVIAGGKFTIGPVGAGSSSVAIAGATARKSHNPAATTPYTTTSASAVDVDSANLSVTFTAPDSGSVIVTLGGLGGLQHTAGTYMLWCLRDAAGTVPNTAVQVMNVNNANTPNEYHSVEIPVDGLTPGESYTLKWGWYLGSGGTARLYAGGAAGAATMRVTGVGALPEAPASAQAFAAKAEVRTAPLVVALAGDSTGDEAAEWFHRVWLDFAAARPWITATYHSWNDGTQDYTATTLQTGTGTVQTLDIYNGSLAGTSLDYQSARLAAMYPVAPDLLFISESHNYGTDTPAVFLAAVDSFVAAFRARYPDTHVVLSSQNPEQAPAANVAEHAARMQALRPHAALRGYGYVAAFEEFQKDGSGAPLIRSDGVHPTTAGAFDGGLTDPGNGQYVWSRAVRRWLSTVLDLAPAAPRLVGASLYLATPQSIVSGGGVPLSFDAEVFDTDAFHDPANPTRLTIPPGKGGIYEISGAIRFSATTGGSRVSLITRNGTTQYGVSSSSSVSAANVQTQHSTALVKLFDGDYVELLAYQDSGTAVTAEADGSSPWCTLSAVRIGDL